MELDFDTIWPERVAYRLKVEAAGGSCGATDNGFTCTEPKNHDGCHIARGVSMNVCHEWAKDGECEHGYLLGCCMGCNPDR